MSKAKHAPIEAEPVSPVRSGWWLATWGEGPQSLAGTPDGASGKITRQALISNPQGMTLGLWADSRRSLPASAARAFCGVIFDGVLYNGAELGGVAPEDSPSPNPAEQVLEGYLRWGEGVLARIKGIFALVLWDVRRDLLLAVRDQVGLHPLFYAEGGRSLLFSSSIDALISHPSVSRELNRAALADHLCYRLRELDETYYTGVKRVPPGHALRVAKGERRVFRYWDSFRPETGLKWTEEEVLERFDRLLDQAVQRAVAEGPAGIFLSGGLDSVSVAAMAVEHSRKRGLPPPWALSMGFPGPECNEEAIQRSVAASLGLPQVMLPFREAAGPQGILAAALEMSRVFPAPLHNVWLPAYNNLGEEGRRQGCQVIMTGGGGDEWLTVSPFLAADLLLSLDGKGLWGLWNSMNRSYKLSRPALLRNILWQFGLRPLLLAAGVGVLRRVAPSFLQSCQRGRVMSRTPAWVAPDPVLKRDMGERAARMLPEFPGEGFYAREGQTGLEHPVVSLEKEELFENSRRQGVKERLPFWDADLVELLCNIPPQLLNLGGKSKGLVRWSLARRFPGLGFDRQRKVSATNFFQSIMAEEVLPVWQALGGAQGLAKLEVVHFAQLNDEVGKILKDKRRQQVYKMWDILSLEAWVRPRL